MFFFWYLKHSVFISRFFLVFPLLYFIFGFNNTFGQQSIDTEHFTVTAYSSESGLRQSMVSQVCQDNLGLIWMVTGDGLHYFDGQECRTFRVPADKTTNHTDNVMRSLVEAGPGRLVITSTSSIITFNTESGQFKTVYRKDGICPIVFNISIDKNPLAWLNGIGFCLVNNTKLDQLKLVFKKGQGFPSDFVPFGLVRVGADEILICGETGLIAIQLTNRISDLVFKADWIPIAGCQAITKTVKGKILILTGSKLLLLDKKKNMTLYFDTKLKGKFNLFTDSRENIWLTEQYNNKIFCLAGKKFTEIKLQTRTGKFTEILAPSVKSIFEDRENNLWFGTDGNGVLLYSPDQVQFQKANIGFTRCVTAYNNKIWAGTYNNGLWELNPDLSEATRINPSHFTNSIYFLDLITDNSGRLWIATRKGINVVDQKGNSISTFRFPCLNAEFITVSHDTITLSCDNKLLQFKASGKPVFINSISYLSTRAFLATENCFWVGTQFGIYRYSKLLGFDNEKAFMPEKNKLSAIPVYGLTYHKGKIWAATDNGFECYNADGSEYDLADCFKSLKNEVIYSVIPDDKERIWFSSNKGIGCITAPENRVVFFGLKHNLQSLEFNHNAALITDDGHIYFGGINGLNHIDPATYHPTKEAPRVNLISLFISDTAYSPCIPSSMPEFSLSRFAPHVSGKVFTDDFPNTGEILYSFYLEGYQSGYSSPSHEASFTYRNIPPGKYRLFVKCADNDLNWSNPKELLSFTIAPPFYTQFWFIVLLAISLIGITILVVKQVQKIRYQGQIREIDRQFAIEKERLRISKDMHDEVGASLTRISILSELAKKQQNEPAKAQQLVDQISEISGNVVDEMSEIIWAMNPRNDTLDSFTSYIRQYSSTYLESAGIEGFFNFPDEIPSHPMTAEIRRNLFLVIKEALHNIVKHSAATSVNLNLFFEHNLIRVQIGDNGRGFNTSKNGSGNGLVNMQKRMDDIGGQYKIASVKIKSH